MRSPSGNLKTELYGSVCTQLQWTSVQVKTEMEYSNAFYLYQKCKKALLLVDLTS